MVTTVLVDSNILIYALNRQSRKHLACREVLANVRTDLVVAHQNIAETLRVITQANFSHVLNSDIAVAAVEKLTANLKIITPSIETEELFLHLVKKYKLAGNTIFDGYLIATALSNGIKHVLTDNVKHIGRFSETIVIPLV